MCPLKASFRYRCFPSRSRCIFCSLGRVAMMPRGAPNRCFPKGRVPQTGCKRRCVGPPLRGLPESLPRLRGGVRTEDRQVFLRAAFSSLAFIWMSSYAERKLLPPSPLAVKVLAAIGTLSDAVAENPGDESRLQPRLTWSPRSPPFSAPGVSSGPVNENERDGKQAPPFGIGCQPIAFLHWETSRRGSNRGGWIGTKRYVL